MPLEIVRIGNTVNAVAKITAWIQGVPKIHVINEHHLMIVWLPKNRIIPLIELKTEQSTITIFCLPDVEEKIKLNDDYTYPRTPETPDCTELAEYSLLVNAISSMASGIGYECVEMDWANSTPPREE